MAQLKSDPGKWYVFKAATADRTGAGQQFGATASFERLEKQGRYDEQFDTQQQAEEWIRENKIRDGVVGQCPDKTVVVSK